MLWCCGLAPDIWAALRAEADLVLGTPGEQRTFDHTTLNQLEVADRVVKETLRLHPAGVISPEKQPATSTSSATGSPKAPSSCGQPTWQAATPPSGTTPSDTAPTGSST